MPAAAESESSQPVMPHLTWSESEEKLIATVPPEVRAWLAGELGDPDDRYASWMERYDVQRQSSSFGAALFELQRLVQTTVRQSGMEKFQVENELIPRSLQERGDLAKGILGEDTSSPLADPQCFRVERGTEYCGQSGFMCCFGDFFCCCAWECNDAIAGGCSVVDPIPCPAGSSGLPGSTEIQQRR